MMAPTSLLIEGTTVVVSVLIGSSLAYWFGSRSARRERLFDSRVSKYDELISLVDDLRAAVVTFKMFQDYDVEKSAEPLHDVIWITGLSGRALGTDRMLACARELKLEHPRTFRTKSSKMELAEKVANRFGTEISLEIGRKMERIRRLKYSLRVVGSTAVTSDTYQGLERALEQVAVQALGKMFADLGISENHQEDEEKTKAVLEQLSGSVEAFLAEVQREVRKTL